MTLADLVPSTRSVWPASTRVTDDGDLAVGGVSLAGVADEYGTPVNVLDLAEFRTRCAAYRAAFPAAEIAYAGKALLTRGVVRIVEAEGMALDVCSDSELGLAVSAGFPPERLILHGNAKSRVLLWRAVSTGVGRIVVDSMDEIEELARVARGLHRQRVLLRITPGVDAGTHRAITTGTEDQKFGLSVRTGAALEAVRRIMTLPALDLIGVHCHIGSQVASTAPYEEAARRAVAFLATVRDELGIVLPQVNLGGGHAIAYRDGDAALLPSALAPSLLGALRNACNLHEFPEPSVTVEPGRAVAGPSGVTVYEVLTVKRTATRTWVAVDGGMSDNPRPALYGARYTAQLIGRASSAPDRCVTVVGRHCESGDVLVEDALLPADLAVGDLLAVPVTGAYHHAMASNYNLTPRPPLIGVEHGQTRTLVRRETFEDLVVRDVG